MGQTVGRMPDTWDELKEEKRRILHWSSEVLARVDDNVKCEDTFLMDYDNERIDEKVDRWIGNHRHKCEVALAQFPSGQKRNAIDSGLWRIRVDIGHQMRKDYKQAYVAMKKFTRKVDALGKEQRKIHEDIRRLDDVSPNEIKTFIAKFGPLRKKVFVNLGKSESIEFRDRRLKAAFRGQVHEIDKKCAQQCIQRIDGLIKKFEKCSSDI